LQCEVGLGNVFLAGWRHKGLLLLAHQPAASGRHTSKLKKVASLHEKRPKPAFDNGIARLSERRRMLPMEMLPHF
jgi:hypothetical protein